jgi:hypothetical protein
MRMALALFLALPLAGCMDWEPADATVQPDQVEVPPGLAVSDQSYRAAYAYAANRVGPAAFARLYRVDPAWTSPMARFDCAPESCLAPERRADERVSFSLLLPDGTRWTGATVTVAPDGSVVPEIDQPYFGLPDCRSRPASCAFLVDEDEARRSAQRAGMEPRDCPLDALFGWNGNLQRFAWQVTDPTCPTPREDAGEGLVVDAATGRIVDRFGWFGIQD